MTRTRTLSVGACVVVVGVSIWVFARPGGVPGIDSLGDGEGHGGIDVAPAVAEEKRAKVRAGEDAESARPRVDHGHTRVRVLMYGSKTPVPGATLLFVHNREQVPRIQPGSDEEEWFRKYGDSVVTDEQGCCLLPLGKRPKLVICRQGGLFGKSYLRRGAGERIIYVREDKTLRVRVTNAGGQAARGVPVHAVSSEAHRGRTWILGVTDSAGELRRRHSQILATKRDRLEVELLAVPEGGKSDGVVVDLVSPPDSFVELRLPKTGSVEIRFEDPSGAPLSPEYFARRDVSFGVFESAPSKQDIATAVKRRASMTKEGQVTIWHVVLNKYIAVSAPTFLRGFRTISGPTNHGERVSVTIKMALDTVGFTALLMDAQGKPIAQRQFLVTCDHKNEDTTSQCMTDAEGWMRVWMPTLIPGREYKLSIRSTGQRSQEGPRPVSLRRTVQLVEGMNSLGRFTVPREMPILSGKVIYLTRTTNRTLAWSVEQQAEDGQWEQVVDARTIKKKGGVFEIYGNAERGRELRLRFLASDSDSRLMPPREFRAGDSDVVIEARFGGGFTATFLVDEKTPWQRLRFVLEPYVKSKEARRTNRIELRPESVDVEQIRCVTKDAEPGRYRLIVQSTDVGQRVMTLESVAVLADGHPNPEGAKADLRGRVRLIQVGIEGQEGRPVFGKNCWILIRNGIDWRGFALRDARVGLAIVQPIDFWALAPGYEMVLTKGVSSSTVIHPKKSRVVRLKTISQASVPQDCEFLVRLRPEFADESGRFRFGGQETGARSFFCSTIRFASREVGVGRVSVSGRLNLQVSLRQGGREARISGAEPDHIVVTRRSSRKTWEIELPEERVETALRELRGR